MISCERCQNGFKLRLNRLNTAASKWPSVADTDAYLNEAYQIWYKSRIKAREVDDFARNDLRQLEVKNKKLKTIDEGWYFVASLPEDYYASLSYAIRASKEGCDGCDKLLVPRVVQSDDLQESLKDPFRKPSFEYEEVLVDEAADALHIYTNGEFTITEVTANYYKKLTPIACPSLVEGDKFYIAPDGTKVDEDSHLEIDSTYAYSDIIDVAVLLFLRDVSDNIEFDTQLKKISIKYQLNN